MHGVALAVSGLWALVDILLGGVFDGRTRPRAIIQHRARSVRTDSRRQRSDRLAAAFHNTRSVTWFLVTTLSTPPFVAGVLLLAAALKGRNGDGASVPILPLLAPRSDEEAIELC